MLTLFLLPHPNVKLRPVVLNMRPGTRVVSHAFTMGEWEPDQTESVASRTACLWIVLAKVEGNWRIDGGGSLVLRQTFQKIDSTLRGAPIGNASLQGNAKGGSLAKWRATRVE